MFPRLGWHSMPFTVNETTTVDIEPRGYAKGVALNKHSKTSIVLCDQTTFYAAEIMTISMV